MHPPFPKARGSLAALLLLTLPVFASAQTNSAATKDKIVMQHNVVYGQGGTMPLHAEIAYPANHARQMPAIIYIHGGGWIGGSNLEGPVTQIARAGYFAASIEYRLSNVAKWPAQIEDCKRAVRWLRANADTYHVDPNRIGVWGASAGGHLVTCLGTMGDQGQYDVDGYPGVSSAVQAVVDYFGPTDFTRPDIYSPVAIQLTEGLFGGPYAGNEAVWKSGSPLYFVKAGDPPMLLVHGDADTLVPIAQSTVFDRALTAAGVPHQFIVVRNGGHGFGAKPGTTIDPNLEQIKTAVYAFFAKYLQEP